MSKKKITLEEAKEILNSDKIFYNGNNKFNVVDIGKYNSGITIEIPQEWTIGKNKKPKSPINYRSSKELTDGMNIDFDGEASILLGKYRLSKNGRPVFELTEPTKAKDTLIQVQWGGAFNKTRGQYEHYAKEVGASFFTRRSSHGGGTGTDYWVLPVDFVRDMERRDVSNILQNIEQQENDRIVEIDNYIKQQDLDIKNSIENRDRILEQLQPIIQNLQTFNPDFTYEANAESFSYKEEKSSYFKAEKYTEDLISKMSELLTKEQSTKSARDTYKPMFQDMEDVLSTLGISIQYEKKIISLKNTKPNFRYTSGYYFYTYSQESYNAFINDVTKYQEELAKEQEEIRRKAEELRQAADLKRRKAEAQEMGYPEELTFWNRLGGASDLAHTYVIESNGTIREPDYNNLRNCNHKHKYSDWKNEADGTQGYIQILPGEAIITYAKAYRATPYVFSVEWADNDITEAQLEVICKELEEQATFAQDIDGQDITDVQQWAISAVKKKSIECKKHLNLAGPSQDEALAEEIATLAEEKNKALAKNLQAKELTQEYEKQLPVQSEQQLHD